jgi:hypothetical protein
MAGSPDPKAGTIVDRHLILFAPRGQGYQGQSPWLVIDEVKGKLVKPVVASTAIGADIKTGRVTP